MVPNLMQVMVQLLKLTGFIMDPEMNCIDTLGNIQELDVSNNNIDVQDINNNDRFTKTISSNG